MRALAGEVRPWFVPLFHDKELSRAAAAGELAAGAANGASGSGAGGISGSESDVRRTLKLMAERAALSRTQPSPYPKRQRLA